MNIGDHLTERVKKIWADECLWDSETGLFYLHARYYDPQLGRFIQEDIVEGDLESPASQNRYTYCQNDPVSLVDPSGYSPQNTNTPTRFGQFNIANLDSPYGCSLSDLQPVLPELQPSSGGEVIGPEEMFVYDSCKKKSRLKGASIEDNKPTRPKDSEMETKVGTEDCGNYTITYGYDQYGNPIAEVKAKEYGSDRVADEIESGINKALWDLKEEGYFDYNKLDGLIKDVASFMGSGGWGELAKVNKAFKDPYTAFYHATTGSAIASEMGSLSDIGINWSETGLSKKEFGSSGKKWTEKNLKILIGTSVSYENKKWNTQLGFYYSTDFKGRMSLGLVDVGNLIMTTIKYESTFNPESVNYDTGDVGLMQKNIGINPNESEEAFRKRAEAEGWFNPFKSVLWGVGGMFNNLKSASSWPSATGGPPTQYEWMQANYYYQGGGVARDKVWADMKTLSSHKRWGNNIIWDWDTILSKLEIDPKTGRPKRPQPRY